METIVSVGANAVIFPFTVVASIQDVFTNIVVRFTRQVMGVPSNIAIETTDFAAHFAIWFCSLHTSRPKSLLYEYDGHKMMFGFSCRAIFESAIIVLKRDLCKDRPIRILTTPVHHKSLVLIMERLTEQSCIEVLTLDERNRSIVVDDAAEEAIKNCDVIVITHMFGRNFDLSKLIELKKKHNKILIVDSVMGGARKLTHGETDVDLDIYSTGQDKRPIAIGGGYCIYRHKIFEAMEAEILSYRVVSRMERLVKLANTMLLRQLYNNRSWLLTLLTIVPLCGLKTTDLVADVRQSNPGFDHNGYLLCPSEAMCRSIKRELDRVQPMEDRYVHCWRLFMHSLSDEVRAAYYPQYDKEDEIIIPYNQLILPLGHTQQYLAFCDRKRICGMTNQNYKTMANAAPKYHDLEKRIHNTTRVMVRDEEIPYLAEALAEYLASDTVKQ